MFKHPPPLPVLAQAPTLSIIHSFLLSAAVFSINQKLYFASPVLTFSFAISVWPFYKEGEANWAI
jgi:hypothetical protein